MTSDKVARNSEKTRSERADLMVGRPGRARWLSLAVLAVAAAIGALLSRDPAATLLVVLVLAALPLLNARPIVWIGLAIVIPWMSRLLTVFGGAPRFLDFLDFPLVVFAVVFAGLRYLGEARPAPPGVRRILRCLLLVTSVIVLSWAFRGLEEPQRLVAGWVLAVEPFLLLVAIVLTPMTARERRTLIFLVGTVLCGQLVFSLFEIAAGARQDDVKGTLLEAGAGHHVSAGGLAIGFMLLVKQRVPRPLVVAFGALTLLVLVTADAKQVLFVLPAALLVLGLGGRRRTGALSLVGGLIGGVAMAAVAVYALLSYRASTTALLFIDRSTTDETGKIAVVRVLWNDVTASFQTALLGFGPGQTVSRFGFLTTPGFFKEGSPVAALGLTTSDWAEYYDKIALAGSSTGKSSFTSAQSSVLGILGDYGLAGLIVFGMLILAVLRALRHAENSGLRATAFAAWTMLLPLALVFDWLEQPPFTLAVFAITGLAIRGGSQVDDEPEGKRSARYRTKFEQSALDGASGESTNSSHSR